MLGFLLLPVACKTPMAARKDAGNSTDARGQDTPFDAPADTPPDLAAKDMALPDAAAADLHSPDLAAPDLASWVGVPKWFRLENHADRTAYLDLRDLIDCEQPVAWAGDHSCNFFGSMCPASCASVPAGASCCVLCEQPLPSMLVIPPGQSRRVEWDGKLHAQILGHCSDCPCLQATPVESGTFAATVRVYGDYLCDPLPCEPTSDDVIMYASPKGNNANHTTTFTIPLPDQDVIIYIYAIPSLDAGTTPDLRPVDLALASDPRPDALPAPFADLPDHTFRIVASATPADASVEPGQVCRPPDGSAVYSIAFSPDGATVRITRADPVQEQVITGKLTDRSDARLAYDLENLFAGGRLIVQLVDGKLAAQLVFFGSGVPVVGCIASPMENI